MSPTESPTKQPSTERSLFDDASTLLMFSKSQPQTQIPPVEDATNQQAIDPAASAAAVTLAAAANLTSPSTQSQYQEEEPKVEDIKFEATTTPTKRKGKKKKKKWPVDDSYIVDPDAGIITCLCDFDDDDGFTIQCDHCNRWQHAVCFGIKDIDSAPENHLCNVCQPRDDLNVEVARRRQLRQRSLLTVQNISPENVADIGKRRKRRNDKDEYNIERPQQKRQNSRHDNIEQDGPGKGQQGGNEVPNIPTPDLVVRRKEHFLTAKEAYGASFLPIDTYRMKNETVALFLDKHKNDAFITIIEDFAPLDIEVKPYADFNYSRTFPGFPKLGTFLPEGCNESALIQEFLGELNFKEDYLDDPRNMYRIWGTVKSKVVFHPNWPLCIDARSCGNLARYIRRCCNPNVGLSTVKIKETNEIKFVLKASFA